MGEWFGRGEAPGGRLPPPARRPGAPVVLVCAALVAVLAGALWSDSTSRWDGARADDRLPTVTEPVRQPVPTESPADPPWRLVWSDEFGGTQLDRSRWNVEHVSTFGDGNGELACLMDRTENVEVRDGALALVARREEPPLPCGRGDRRFRNGRDYSSAMVTTQDLHDWTYGRFEVRARTPTAQGTSKGLWPAFWLRPTGGGVGELDVLEAVGSAAGEREWDVVHHTVWYDYQRTHPKQEQTVTFPTGSPADGMHTYAAEWEPGEIRWYVDGRLTYVRTLETTSWLDEAFSRPFFLRLNLAVGGTWPGAPDDDTLLPARYEIDYVRVFQR